MQYLVLWLISILGYGIAELVKRALAAVGFGLVTYFGAYAIFDQLKAMFTEQLAGLPSDVLAILGIMQLDVAFTMILSAVTAKKVLEGWDRFTDSRKGRIWRKPGSSDPTQLGA